MKKLINDPGTIIDDMIDGLLAAHPGHLKRLDSHPRALVHPGTPRSGKVAIVTGGGSGHEPAFAGYVGPGMADAAAVGNVFASPPPDPIVEATKAVHGGAGVVYIYGNYAGDVMNFDMAAEMCAMDDIRVETVRVTDDVASARPEERDKRRGVAGDFFVFKIAGAAADLGYDLDGVVRAATRANESTLSMGVALEPCSLPQTGEPSFTMADDEMEIGLGVHGEPGVRRGKLESSAAVMDTLVDHILGEMPLGQGDRVAVLMNGLGSTTRMELYIAYRQVANRLGDLGVDIHRAYVGDYVTSLEMGGCSVSILKLDDELTRLLDHPADAAMFRQA